ncbi:MAG: hypothetical protein ACM34L_04130 [Gemmatimonas sp.]|nr:hypothetical protein [Gemmatimonadaceae bacterium]
MPDAPVVPHARLNVGSVYGMLGFLAALAVHESTFTASTLSPDNPLFWAMHAGIFPLFFPMVFGLRKWSETRTGAFGISTRRLRWRAILPYLPQWAIAVGAVLFVYALINFVLAMNHMPPRGPVGVGTRTMDPEQARNLVRAFSGHWLLFYAIPTLYFLFVPSAPRTDSGGRASG